jgi:5-histidylcysteine sulfoxide synthase/putative 4-mercaptohistidine N1-methyltranferase
MNGLIAKTIHLNKGDAEKKRQEIRGYFQKTWAIEDLLYKQLKDDDAFYMRADPLRHPIIFYLGHTAVFYMNKLILAKIIHERINPRFESIFAIGVDEMSWDDLNEAHYDWPAVNELWDYRAKVKQTVLDVIDNTPLTLPVNWESPFWIVMMGIEHVRIHLETSSVLIRQLPLEKLNAGVFAKPCKLSGDAPSNEFVPVDGGVVDLGKDFSHRFYGWDNEYGKYTEMTEDFLASKYLISNGEYLSFVQDNGYHKKEWWTEEGRGWQSYQKAEYPRFWRLRQGRYFLRLMAAEIEMPWNWPVEVNYLEAKAFANWKSSKDGKTYRLPTEAEWYRLASENGIGDENYHAVNANINLQEFASPCPVNAYKQGNLFDIIGNVWQWTETPITGYPGFKVHPMYDDFSTPTFDGKHNLIKGGSWISTGNEHTWHSRYAFRRHFYQHAGFRLVQSGHMPEIREDAYETDAEVARSCEANYGQDDLGIPNFSKTIAGLAVDAAGSNNDLKVLDLNCDTGRAAFELSKHFKNVSGLDFSARFIKIANQLQENGFIRYITPDENDLVFYTDVQLSDIGINKPVYINFMQADANNLKPIYSAYDLILAANLLEELYNPVAFLKNIHERLNSGGIFVLGSTYNWQRNKIDKKNRPGGFKADGEPVSSFEGIREILSDKFVLIKNPFDVKKVVKNNSREFSVEIVEFSLWKKKN